MIRKNDWENVRTFVESLANVQICLYCEELDNLVYSDAFRNSIFWQDGVKFLDLLHAECVKRLRLTLPEEDR